MQNVMSGAVKSTEVTFCGTCAPNWHRTLENSLETGSQIDKQGPVVPGAVQRLGSTCLKELMKSAL